MLHENNGVSKIIKMALYNTEFMEDLIAEAPCSTFLLQKDEVRVLDRMSTRAARRKISLPTRLSDINEVEKNNNIFSLQDKNTYAPGINNVSFMKNKQQAGDTEDLLTSVRNQLDKLSSAQSLLNDLLEDQRRNEDETDERKRRNFITSFEQVKQNILDSKCKPPPHAINKSNRKTNKMEPISKLSLIDEYVLQNQNSSKIQSLVLPQSVEPEHKETLLLSSHINPSNKPLYNRINSNEPPDLLPTKDILNIKSEAKRRYSVTDSLPVFPYLDSQKKAAGKFNINNSLLYEIPEEMNSCGSSSSVFSTDISSSAKYSDDNSCEEGEILDDSYFPKSNGNICNKEEEYGDAFVHLQEDEFDLCDELFLLPCHILGLDSDEVEESLNPLISNSQPKNAASDSQNLHWDARQASLWAGTIWVFKGETTRDI